MSLNALTNNDTENSIKLKAMVKNKVMLILLDSGSSHSFVSKEFVELTKMETVLIQPRKVKLANGEYLTTDAKVQNLEWYIQGHTLSSEMLVLDMAPYDAILSFDWLKQHSLMECDWTNKTL